MNPIELAANVEDRYRQYLKTTFYFRDSELRASFEEALATDSLTKGPFIEATPAFQRETNLKELAEKRFRNKLEGAFIKALQGDRPLYKHQEESIIKCSAGRNVLIATGTGSGKTESFLYPILLHLYEEHLKGVLGPGVRALILYPMNALANDQRLRLGTISKNLQKLRSAFNFTFGQYIGDTPEHEQDTRRMTDGYAAMRYPGELIYRSEMRETPPHVLLTNYSMLEYLLVRPHDSPLFDNGNATWWTFIVLDEAHQYRGTNGIEMAFLLRRLKQRMKEGGRVRPVQCIATSATLMSGDKDKAPVAKFAADLFGEKYEIDDIIQGRPIIDSSRGVLALSRSDYDCLHDAIVLRRDPAKDAFYALIKKHNIANDGVQEINVLAGALLSQDSRSGILKRAITNIPKDVNELADHMFGEEPEAERSDRLNKYVELLSSAIDPKTETHLLNSRYHIFIRSLEGAFVSYWPEKKVFLNRMTIGSEWTAFEIALCRQCGQHYILGPKNAKSGKLIEPIRDVNNDKYGVTYFRPVEGRALSVDEDKDDTLLEPEVYSLCMQCGELALDKPTCGHELVLRVIKEPSPKSDERADQLSRCGACGYTAAGRDPVREIIYGADGPHAVIATTLHQLLPENRKKVLAFADGRQEAAYFAWYLDESYKDVLSRNLIFETAKNLIEHAPDGLSISEIAHELHQAYKARGVYPESLGDIELRREAWKMIYSELLTDESRISIEGVGLAKWGLKWPTTFEAPHIFMRPPWSLNEEGARALAFILIDTMRVDGAVEIRTKPGITLNWLDLGLRKVQTQIKIDEAGSGNIRSWDTPRGKRATYLTKILMKKGFTEEDAINAAKQALRSIWDYIRQSDTQAANADGRLLMATVQATRMNPDWYRLRPIMPDEEISICETCKRIQPLAIEGVCIRHGCQGEVIKVPFTSLEQNHYRRLYTENLPGSLRVEEHTAQLDKEKAKAYQKDFSENKINVLSCSTTFELGVDLGDLDTIFLRNVPPEGFNYTQRVGRAGRRSGQPGFAVTYCRRTPHDLYHFSDPMRVMKGNIRPPMLRLVNEKIVGRHIVAAALSEFFRANQERFKNVESLLVNLESPSLTPDFSNFLQERQAELANKLKTLLPSDSCDGLGLNDGSWITRIAGSDSRLAEAEAVTKEDYIRVKAIEYESRNNQNYTLAQWAKLRAKTIAEEDVLSYLSRKTIIPKYGFPVDVVELDTQRAKQSYEAGEVALQRDLTIAISEFAPGSEVVANKRVWKSYALKKVAEKEWPRWWYQKCSEHNRFERFPWEGDRPAVTDENRCCNRMITMKYIEPRFGFITDREQPHPPREKPVKAFSTRPYFGGYKGRPGEIIERGPLLIKAASPGCLVVLCEGRKGGGFYICGSCGAGFSKRTKETKHKTPFGTDCRGILNAFSLGHEFITDVLELQFMLRPEAGDPLWLAYSLAYALVEGAAEILEVPSTDLNATVYYGTIANPLPPIILYDNVPGGAGLISRLENPHILKASLEEALNRVNGGCGCDEMTSCYGCLRNYRNQFAHPKLQRGPVRVYLEKVLENLRHY